MPGQTRPHSRRPSPPRTTPNTPSRVCVELPTTCPVAGQARPPAPGHPLQPRQPVLHHLGARVPRRHGDGKPLGNLHRLQTSLKLEARARKALLLATRLAGLARVPRPEGAQAACTHHPRPGSATCVPLGHLPLPFPLHLFHCPPPSRQPTFIKHLLCARHCAWGRGVTSKAEAASTIRERRVRGRGVGRARLTTARRALGPGPSSGHKGAEERESGGRY